jgi:hypothetical protein
MPEKSDLRVQFIVNIHDTDVECVDIDSFVGDDQLFEVSAILACMS